MTDISLAGRAAVITGAGRGLGEAIARAYVEAGASVLLCSRTEDELVKTRDRLRTLCGRGRLVESIRADVSKRDDVDRIYAAARRLFPRIHILVNNAGVYGPKGRIEDIRWEEWVHAVEINLLGSVMMSGAFLPHFREHGYGKIIQLSGGGATAPFPFISAYAASKAAVVRFAETLAEEVRDNGIDVNAIAPGALNTRMLDEVIEAGPEKVGRARYERSLQQKADGGAPPERAAKLAVFLASGQSDGITGKLISAVWDPWETLPEHLDELKTTDIYTLRRIVPKDRGKNWGDV